MKKISKKTLNSSFWRWWYGNLTCFSHEHMQTWGYMWSMLPIIQELYATKEEQQEKLRTYYPFFNTEPQIGCIVVGITAGLEEARANGAEGIDDEMINGIRAGLMGPLAGIGDTIGWAMIPTIFGSIGASMAMQGNPLGIFLWLAFTIAFLAVRILQYEWGYNMGVNVITKFGKQITVFTEACSVLGLTVVGSLIATVVKLKTGITFTNGDVIMEVQGLIDGVMPQLLPVAAVAIIYFFMAKKKVKMTWMILFIIIASWIGAATGIFTA